MCERFDCPQDKTETRDCSLCGMPVITRDIDAILRIYNQTKIWNALPCAGGIFDQPAQIMDLLEVAEGEAQRCRARRIENERMELERTESLRRMQR